MTPLLLLALAAAPEAAHADKVAVLVVRRTSVTVEEGRAFAEAAAAVLKGAGVAVEEPSESLRRLGVLGVTDPNVCSGRKACVLELARQLEVGGIVAISAAALQQERSVVFEATRVLDGSSLAKDAAVLKAGTPVLTEHLAAVSRALAAAFPRKADAPVVERKAAPVPAPAPRLENEKEKVVIDSPAPLPPAEPEHSHTATFVSGGLAAAAVVTAVVLGVVAMNARSQATATMTVNGELVSALPASRAKELAGQANGFGAGAGVAAGVAVALGVVAVVTW